MIAAVCIAVLFGLLWLARWHWNRRKEGKPGVEPVQVIAAGFVIVAAGFVWQAFYPPVSRADMEALQAGFDKFVKPRELSAEQAAIIVEYLLKRPPAEKIDIVFWHPDEEAQHYAAKLNMPFLKADWKPTLRAVMDGKLPNGNVIKDGVTFFVEYAPNNRENSRILRVAEEAFQAAKVHFSGMNSWTNPEATETKVLICIGHRPRR